MTPRSFTSPTGFDPRSLSIPVKMALGIVGILVLTSLVADVFVRQIVFRSEQARFAEDLRRSSESHALRIVDAVGEVIVKLNRLGTSSALQEALTGPPVSLSAGRFQPDFNASIELNRFILLNSEFSAVVLTDRNGVILAAEPDLLAGNITTPAAWPWYAEASGQGEVYIGTLVDDALTGDIGRSGIGVAVPLTRQDDPDTVVGVLYGVWNLGNIAGSVAEEGGRTVSVIAPDGRVVLASDQITGAVAPVVLTDALATLSEVLPVYPDPDGTEYMMNAVTINELGLSGSNPAARLAWVVVTRQPAADLQRAILDFLGSFRLILLGNVIFVGVFTLLFTRVIMNPLNKLTRISREIEVGHLAMRIPELPADEIGQFADVLRRVVSRLTARLDQLNAAAQVSRIAALTLDLSQSLGRVAHAVNEQLGYPEVRIYLADMSRQRLVVQAGAGPESERMTHAASRAPLDESSLIGRAALLGEPQVGGGVETPKFAGGVAQPAEVALPLQAGGRTLGVLHVIADRPGAFGREDVDILRLIGDQIAASVENARLYEESKSSLVEIEALNRRLTQTAWEEQVSESGDTLRHTLDPEGHWPDLVDHITDSVEVRAETFIDAAGRNVLAAPLVLRGQPVGTLAVTRPADEHWTMDEVVLVESIASRMVMIAEGIRLVEESSRRAERERQVNEVSADLIQRAASVDTILQTALSKLSGALGSDHVSLRIGAPPVEPGHRITSGERTTRTDPPVAHAQNGDGGLNDDSDQPL